MLTNNGPEGGIMGGVHSLSEATPLKQTDFAYADRAFEGATKYSDWLFAYVPQKSDFNEQSCAEEVNELVICACS